MENKDKTVLMLSAYYNHVVVGINDINEGTDPMMVLTYLKEYTSLYNDVVKRIYERFFEQLKLKTEGQSHIKKETVMEILNDLYDTLLAQLDSYLHR